MRKRPLQLLVMVSEQERKQLDELCQKTGLKYSVLIRKMISETKIKERPNVDFFDLRQAIDRIGNNLNQIAHWANANGGISEENTAEALRLMKEVKATIRRWSELWL
ncbi:MAG: MobC family plasmid mobilization relaxosome protein [Clostridia bacterium]|nr:MobC family plasmid mobilization relaxosome protein [Clostridia bacterium]